MNNQAVFVLKGKPLNVWDLKRDVMYKNDEMYNLMQSLNVEDNTEGLRYDKVILATDADVDGLHIRNLMITYFFKFFEALVHDGHVHRARRKVPERAPQPEAGLGGPVDQDLVRQVDQPGRGEPTQHLPFHHADERVLVAEIRRQRDHAG